MATPATPQEIMLALGQPLAKSAETRPDRNEILFNREGVTVSRALLRFPNQTFPVSSVSSVSFGTMRSRSWIASVIVMVTGVALMFVLEGAGLGVFVFLAGLIWLGIDRLRDREPEYHVVLLTSGGEVRPFTTPDEGTARDLVTAIERALAT